MSLTEQRMAIAHLLDEKHPQDATAVYYANHHPDNRIRLFPFAESDRVLGYVALAQTGMDLFRPFVTMRLPIDDFGLSTNMIYEGIGEGTAVILNAPQSYAPLLQALFDIQVIQTLHLYVLDIKNFQTNINILTEKSMGPNDLPRFLIKQPNASGDRETVAASGLNWLSPEFGELSVRTQSAQRRQGMGYSVVNKMTEWVLTQKRKPLYMVAADNHASITLAERVGFVDSGYRQTLLEGILKPKP